MSEVMNVGVMNVGQSAVIGGTNIIRARTHLSVILVEDHFGVYEEISSKPGSG